MADQTTTIPKGWKASTLEEVVLKANTGADAIKRAPIVNKDTGIKCLRIQDVSQKKDYKNWGFTSVSDSDFKKFQLKNGELFIARTGASIGANLIINKDLNAVFNNGLIRLRVNEKSIPSYVSYLLFSQHFKNYILSISQGTSTQPNIQIGALLRFPIVIPPIPEQNAIVSILSSLDKKIELLKEQNSALETTAQVIFKEWFVNFNFPGATGKMVDSELGEIPEGWKVDRLSEIIVFEGGAQPPKSEHIYEPRDGYVRFIQNRDYSNSSHITYIKESKKNKLCEVFDIMMDKYGDVGVPRWGLVGAYNVALAKIVPKIKNSREYLRSYFSQRAVFSLLSASAQASTRGSLNEGTFKGVTLIIPDEITLERFEKLQSKFLSKILFNNAEVETLSQLRDTLLPKLMKGEVRAKEFDK